MQGKSGIGERAKKQDPKGISLMRAATAMRLGDWRRAACEADAVLAQDPRHLPALELKAKALWKCGEYTALLAVVDRLVSLHPYESGYFELRGMALQALGRYGEALGAFQRCPDRPATARAIEDLEALQARLVCDLLESDAVFRAAFMRDPDVACASRGYRFVSQAPADLWHLPQRERIYTYGRPS